MNNDTKVALVSFGGKHCTPLFIAESELVAKALIDAMGLAGAPILYYTVELTTLRDAMTSLTSFTGLEVRTRYVRERAAAVNALREVPTLLLRLAAGDSTAVDSLRAAALEFKSLVNL
jgi:hypothetical protein